MIVAVETENPVKLDAVEIAFGEAFPQVGVRVRQVVCDLPIPDQPFDDAIAEGARERARAAIEAIGADFGVGIEAGLLRIPGLTHPLSVQICAIAGRDGTVTVGLGPGYELPPDIEEAVVNGEPLREAFERILQQDDPQRRGAIYSLSQGRIDRTDLTVSAVRMALLPWVSPHGSPLVA